MSQPQAQKPFHIFDVRGRAGRGEFALMLALWAVAVVLFSTFARVSFPAGLAFGLASSLPMLLTGVRRLHDRGQSGWWLLMTIVPVINLLFLIMLAQAAPEAGPNRYGAPPAGLAPGPARG